MNICFSKCDFCVEYDLCKPLFTANDFSIVSRIKMIDLDFSFSITGKLIFNMSSPLRFAIAPLPPCSD